MDNVIVKRNNWIETKQDFPKIFIIYFIGIQICFDVDCGIILLCNEKYRAILKSIYRVKAIVILVISATIISSFSVLKILYIFYLIQYITCMLILTFTKYNVYEFLIDIFCTRKNRMSNEFNVFGIATVFYTISIIFFNMIVIGLYCLFYSKSCKSFFDVLSLAYFPIFGLDIISIVQVVILYAIYLNVKYMKRILTFGERNLDRIVSLYMSITKHWENIAPLYSKLVSLISKRRATLPEKCRH